MSSKAIGQQQQGRRTPLSLAGGKNNHHQQQNQSNSNKSNYNSNNNSAKNQEPKDSTSNKNNNQAGKNQQESRDPTPTQKVTKKNQQNGNKHEDSGDSVIFVEENGTANGNSSNNSNGGMPNKKSGSTAKATNQSAGKDNNKEKDKDSEEPETSKEKSDQKSKKGDGAKANEKKQNDLTEKQTTASPPTGANKSKDGSTTPKANQAGADKKSNAGTTSPTKPVTSNNAQEKSSTPSKTEKPEKSAAATPTKTSATPSKSPKAAEKNSKIVVEETAENEIEPLVIDSSPPKKINTRQALALTPAATSTPGKAIGGNRGNNAKSEIQLTMETTRRSVDRKSVPRSYSDISGRRSIRTCGDFTPSMYNSQFRESYRRINTELDVTGHTNTSMNVTVGSEIPNNSSFLSFSLFGGRGRKRERTPPPTVPEKSQSAVELTMETTPPKRARLDVQGIFSVMSSPLTMLRTRFSKATLDTPVKEKPSTLTDDVQNVSGVSIEEVVASAEVTATEDITVGKEAILEKTPSKVSPAKGIDEGDAESGDGKTMYMDVDGDIKITETLIIPAVGEPKIKQRGCLVM